MAQIMIANNAAPVAPLAGNTTLYVDSTTKQLSAINDTGAIYTMGPTLSGKNKLVNGAFQFWQVGTSASSGYVADQWFCGGSGTLTWSQVTLSGVYGAQYGLTWTSGAVSSYGAFAQPLEQAEVIPLRGKTMTFSMYVSSSTLAGSMNFLVLYSNSSDAQASQLTSVPILSGATFTPTATMTRFSCTFTVPLDAVGLYVGAMPANTTQASGVSVTHAMAQLEIGILPTPFETLPYALELMRCQRFYYAIGGLSIYQYAAMLQCISTTAAYGMVFVPVSMRTTPSINVSSISHWLVYNAGGGGVATTAITANQSGNQLVSLAITATGLVAGSATILVANGTLSARLILNARL